MLIYIYGIIYKMLLMRLMLLLRIQYVLYPDVFKHAKSHFSALVLLCGFMHQKDLIIYVKKKAKIASLLPSAQLFFCSSGRTAGG